MIFLLLPLPARAEIVFKKCAQDDDMVLCVDTDDFAYVFIDDRAWMVLDTLSGEYRILDTGETGNLYGTQAKENFLSRFGRALEDGFSRNYDRPSYQKRELPVVDPMCITPLQRKTNNCK